MSEKTPKKFDDWNNEVPCDTCELYYNSQCDSIKSECNSYKPTRRAKLECRMRKLEDNVKVYGGLVMIVYTIIIFQLLRNFIWR